MKDKVTIRKRHVGALGRRSKGPGIAGALARLGWGLLLLLLCSGAAAVLLLAVDLLDPAQLPALLPGGLAVLLQDLPTTQRLAVAAGALVLGMGAAVALISPLRGRDRGRDRSAAVHVLNRDDHGMVVVATRSVSTVARAAALRVPAVLDADVRRVRTSNGPASLSLRVWVLAGAEVRQVGEEVREAVRDAVERLVGLSVQSVRVEMEVVAPEDEVRMLE